ncbi:MAG TPA: DUF4382 domain-containing protein [Ramlibacter sp.]|nr:DUF4382 domain-containing protein [Ramlibacter sp.]
MRAENDSGGRWTNAVRWIGALGIAAMMAACGGGGGSAASTDGSLRVALTDAPSCGFDHVFVTVEQVRVHQSASAADSDAGWTDINITPARKIDLTTLTNGVLEELGTTTLPAGQYSQIRLVLSSNASGTTTFANSVQPTGGTLTALTTPSAQQSGLKLQAHFEVASGQTADLVLDFDACKSIVSAGNSGKFILKPVISVLPRVVTGLQGFVTTTLSLSSTTVAAQQNGLTVRSTVPDSTGKFTIPFLPAGTYTLVITSDGHATGVITGVPAGTTTTVINGTATAIATPVSAMADVTGTMTVTSVSGSSTVSIALTDATAFALQSLTGGPAIELGQQPVDSVLGTYRFHLPVGAPVKAAFAGGGALSFAPDAAAAGKYTIQAQSPGRATQTKPADISGGTSTAVNFAFGP